MPIQVNNREESAAFAAFVAHSKAVHLLPGEATREEWRAFWENLLTLVERLAWIDAARAARDSFAIDEG